jgi:hypothetical protein
LTFEELQDMQFLVGTSKLPLSSYYFDNGRISMYCYCCSLAIELPDGPYAGSMQESDLYVAPRGHLLPTLIMASGFSES